MNNQGKDSIFWRHRRKVVEFLVNDKGTGTIFFVENYHKVRQCCVVTENYRHVPSAILKTIVSGV